MKQKYLKKFLVLFTVFLLAVVPFTRAYALPEGVPSSLEAPTIKKIELKKDDEGKPYFDVYVYFPQSVLNLDSEAPGDGSVFWDYSEKIDDGEWSEFGGGGYIDVYTGGVDGEAPVAAGEFVIRFTPMDEGSQETVDIKNHIYSYKIKFYYDYYEGWPNIEPIYSPESNSLSIGSGSFYADISAWAKDEVTKANEYELIPEILKGADMTKPITREEFCELAVLLYEKVTGNEAVAVSPNPFTDTDNTRILKAYALKITNGTSPTLFSAKTLITREQCAAMLFRAIGAIAPTADYSVDGVKDFPDQKEISAYAVQATKYMANLGIIKGNNSGYFMPKASSDFKDVQNYGMATREAAILMTVRTYEITK